MQCAARHRRACLGDRDLIAVAVVPQGLAGVTTVVYPLAPSNRAIRENVEAILALDGGEVPDLALVVVALGSLGDGADNHMLAPTPGVETAP